MRILGRGRMHPERLNQLMMGTIGKTAESMDLS